MRTPTALLTFAVVASLAACGGDAGTQSHDPDNPDALPQPQATSGGITGMPSKPGPGEVPLTGEPPASPPPLLPAEAFGLPSLEDNPEAGLREADATTGDPAVAASEPGPAEAAAVVSGYYAAINTRNYPLAYGLWSDGGRSSGQTPEQFAAGFAQTATVALATGTPGEIEGAAGSRFIEVPVSITATMSDGSLRRYSGRYTLRRAVVDGASNEQRAWHIASADLKPVAP
jgi:hypothetical protein